MIFDYFHIRKQEGYVLKQQKQQTTRIYLKITYILPLFIC